MPDVLKAVLPVVVAAVAVAVFGPILGSIIGAVLAVGTSMLLDAIFPVPKPNLNFTAQDRKQMVRQPVAPRRIIYGAAKVGGTLVYVGSSGADQRYLHLVAELACHPCHAIDSVFVNDVEITAAQIGGNGMVTAGPMAGRVRVKRYLGTQTTADADLIAESPDGWSADHKLLGRTYIYVRLEYSREAFAAGLQNVAALVRGKNDILDPRGATSVGYTTNWALCVLDYLRSPMGVGAIADEIDTATFIAAANLSDELVDLDAGGTTTQARYTCDMAITRDQSRRQILGQMLTAGAGALTYVQGRYCLYGGAYTQPTASLGVSDLAGDVRLTTKGRRKDLFNAVKGTFIDPVKSWQPAEFPGVTSGTFETEDGERIWRELELPATIDATRAQRLARIELLRGREPMMIEAPIRYAGIRFAVWQMLSVTVPAFGWTNKPMRILGWRFEPNTGAIALRLREESAAAYAWVHDDASALGAAPDTTLISPVAIPTPTSLAVAATTALQADGAVAPALVVTWTAAAHAFVTASEVQWRVSAGPGAWSAAQVPAGTTRFVIAPVRVGEQLDVRVRALAGLAPSAWTSTVQQAGAADTTAPGAPTSPTGTGVQRGASWRWTNDTASDLDLVEVWEAATQNGSYAKVGESRSDFWVSTGWTPGETRWALMRSRDRSGNYSGWAGPISATARLSAVDDIAPNSITRVLSSAASLALNRMDRPGAGYDHRQVVHRTITLAGDGRALILVRTTGVTFNGPADYSGDGGGDRGD